jgi:hypothetical protein
LSQGLPHTNVWWFKSIWQMLMQKIHHLLCILEFCPTNIKLLLSYKPFDHYSNTITWAFAMATSITSYTLEWSLDTCWQKTTTLNFWTVRHNCHSKPNATWVHSHWPPYAPNGTRSNVIKTSNHVSNCQKYRSGISEHPWLFIMGVMLINYMH